MVKIGSDQLSDPSSVSWHGHEKLKNARDSGESLYFIWRLVAKRENVYSIERAHYQYKGNSLVTITPSSGIS